MILERGAGEVRSIDAGLNTQPRHVAKNRTRNIPVYRKILQPTESHQQKL